MHDDIFIRLFSISGVILFSVMLLIFGAGILVPLAISLLVWFFLNALADTFQHVKLASVGVPRNAALLLSFLTTAIIGFAVVEVIARHVPGISARLGEVQTILNPWIDKIAVQTGVSSPEVMNKILDQIGIERLLGKIIYAMVSFSSQIGIIFIYVIFLLVEQQFFDLKLRALIKDEGRQLIIRQNLKRIASGVKKYMWIMSVISAMTAGLSYLVMRWLGLGEAGFWAFLIFVLNFIPTIGSVLAALLPSVYALVQFQALAPTLVLLLALGFIHFFLGNIVQPRMASRSLNMSQFAVILALAVWGAMWGIAGMFLAVPLTSILMIVFSNFEITRPVAILLSQDGDIDETR